MFQAGYAVGTKDITVNNKHSLLWNLHSYGEKHSVILSYNCVLSSSSLCLSAMKEKKTKTSGWDRDNEITPYPSNNYC